MRRTLRLPRVLCLLFLGFAAGCADEPYDLIIRGGTVVDGTGGEPYRADVGVRGDRIAAIGNLSRARATHLLEAEGLHLAPGFIDLHSHADGGLVSEERSVAHALLAQGLTTVVINADGRSPDLVRQREQLLEHGLGVNVAQLVGHNTARVAAMGGSHDRPPTAEELEEMRATIRAGMEAGAFGLSTGLFYTPSSYAETDEVIALAEVVAEYGGVHSSHIRDESDYTVGVVNAVQEIIDISRATGVTGIVSHIKALGPNVWGHSEEIVARIEAARAEGLSIWADQYPYAASQTSLVAALFPAWAQEGGGLRGRLRDPAMAARIRPEVADNLARRGGADRLQFTGGDYMGRTLADHAGDHGLDPVDAAIRIVLTGGATGVVSHNMHDDDIHRLMRQPWMATSTDGFLPEFGRGMPHPRGYGSYARKLRKYVLEDRVIDLPFAIRSMSAVGAEAIGSEGRGVLEEGAFADIVVFDLARVNDPATYMDPHQLSEGMVHVLVNGVPAIRDGEFTNALAGRVLSRHGPERAVGGEVVAEARTGERTR